MKAPKVAYHTFAEIGSASPPSINGFAWQDTFNGTCSQDDFRNQRFSCTNYDWAEKLDAWMTLWIVAAAEQSGTTISPQDDLIFTLNNTKPDADGDIDGFAGYWVPSRQVVSTFSKDAQAVEYISKGYNATDIDLVRRTTAACN